MNRSQTNSQPTIVEFRKEDAAKLARLLNSFDKEGLWPGGFTGGVPFTPERVLDSWPVAFKYISVLISKDDGKFTGICSLHPHYEDEEASYIGLLGVHPDYLGRGHGKTLILRSLEIAKAKNLKRVDLHTWAGNLKAVPLYKKCGMVWVPETSVEMHNYIPNILNFPLAKTYFAKHNWYSSQIRKLELKPDRAKLGDMEVFTYEFTEGEDYLRVWVDRYSRGIIGIERELKCEHLKIIARLRDHQVVKGTEQTLIIEVENETYKQLQGSLFLSGFNGLNFTSLPQKSFTVEKGDSNTIRAKFQVSPKIEVRDIYRKQQAIEVNIILNGELIPLEVGLRLLSLLQFETTPETIAVTPGTTGYLHFNIFNNAKENFRGNITVVDEVGRLNLKKKTIPLQIEGKNHFGFSLAVRVPEDLQTDVFPLKLLARGRISGRRTETLEHVRYVKCITPGGIAVTEEDTKYGRAVIVENLSLVASIRLRRGSMDIVYKDTLRGREKVLNSCRFEVGPPFGFVKPLNFKYEIKRRLEGLDVEFITRHPDKPGIKMTRILTFHGGTSIIEEKVRVVNMNPEKTYNLKAQLCRSNWLRGFHYKMVIPLEEVVEHEMVEFPVSEQDLPTDPRDFRESWICFQKTSGDFSFGFLWGERGLSKIKVGEFPFANVEFDLGDVKPGQSVITPAFYYVLKGGNWQGIRREWRQLVERKIAISEGDEVKSLFEVKLAENLLFSDSPLKTSLAVKNTRNKGVTGKIKLSPPDGWEIQPSEVSIKDVAFGDAYAVDVTLTPPKDVEFGIHEGKLFFSTTSQNAEFPLDLCVLSNPKIGDVTITSEKDGGIGVERISNGLLQFKSSAEFAGCLYFLGKVDDNTNNLRTIFPKFGTRVFLENYTGGIRALWAGEDFFDFQKSHTHEEAYKIELLHEPPWKGVRYTFRTEKQEELKGVRGSISYLTLPYSNIVKIRRDFENLTQALFHFTNCLWFSPNIGGGFEEQEVAFPRGDQILRFKRAKGFPVGGVKPEEGWITVKNEAKNVGVAMIAGDIKDTVLLSFDLGTTLLEIFAISRVQLRPSESRRLEDYLILNKGDLIATQKLAKILRQSNPRILTRST